MRLGPVGIYRVSGPSMLPAFRPGDMVLGNRWAKPGIGQVVVLKTKERFILKRLKRQAPGQVWLEGDNLNQSTDSREHGLYQAEAVEAVVIWRF